MERNASMLPCVRTVASLVEWLLARAPRRPGRRRRCPGQARRSSSATTSTTDRALPSSAVQAGCWSRPTTTTRLPFESDCAACSAWSRQTITVKNDASCSRRPDTARRTSSQALDERCRILLACGEGTSNREVADRLGVSRPTVTKWRSRFVARRLDGLADEPRPGAPDQITDEQVERVIVTTLEQAPTDATHWSTRTLARQLGMSQTSISRIWPAFGLKPHLTEAFKLSTDPQFTDKVRDVVGLYLNPREAAPVLCVTRRRRAGAGPYRSCGPRPPTRSSTPSPTANESTTQ